MRIQRIYFILVRRCVFALLHLTMQLATGVTLFLEFFFLLWGSWEALMALSCFPFFFSFH